MDGHDGRLLALRQRRRRWLAPPSLLEHHHPQCTLWAATKSLWMREHCNTRHPTLTSHSTAPASPHQPQRVTHANRTRLCEWQKRAFYSRADPACPPFVAHALTPTPLIFPPGVQCGLPISNVAAGARECVCVWFCEHDTPASVP